MSFLDVKIPVATIDSFIEDVRKQVADGILKTSTNIPASKVDLFSQELITLLKILRTELQVCSSLIFFSHPVALQ